MFKLKQRTLGAVCALLSAALLAACNGAPAQPTPTPTVVVIPTPMIAPVATQPPKAPQPAVPVPASPTIAPQAAAPQVVAPTPAPALPAQSACVNKAANVRDVTIPDGSALKVGATFTKTWSIRNGGTCTWTDGYTLVFNLGDRMDAPDGTRLPNTLAGSDATVSVVLRAPLTAGRYKGFWKLRDANGRDFGTGPDNNIAFWVEIVVRR